MSDWDFNRGGFVAACNAARVAARERQRTAKYSMVPKVGDQIEVRFGLEAPWLKATVRERDPMYYRLRVDVDRGTYTGTVSSSVPFWNSAYLEPNPIWQWRWPGQDNNGRPSEAEVKYGSEPGWPHHPVCPPERGCATCARANGVDVDDQPEADQATTGKDPDYTERDRIAKKYGLDVSGDDHILMNGPNGPEVIKRKPRE